MKLALENGGLIPPSDHRTLLEGPLGAVLLLPAAGQFPATKSRTAEAHT